MISAFVIMMEISRFHYEFSWLNDTQEKRSSDGFHACYQSFTNKLLLYILYILGLLF